MYLSCLLIDTGNDPDRPRPGRAWLRNRYRVHQRLCMAFPSAFRRGADPQFLKPFAAGDFSEQVHVARGADAGFLFRVDPQPGGRAVILAQSVVEPDWEYAFHNAAHLLAGPPEVKAFNPSFSAGQVLRFRLRANPTKKLTTRTSGKEKGLRVGLYDSDQQREWLERKAAQGGFRIVSCDIVPEGRLRARKPDVEVEMPLLSVRFEGVLEVNDPSAFEAALRQGIGSAKAFGFGLLSVAPAR